MAEHAPLELPRVERVQIETTSDIQEAYPLVNNVYNETTYRIR